MTKSGTHTDSEATGREFDAIPWVAGALFVLGLAILAGLYWSDNMSIRKVRFEGHGFVTEGELQKQVDIPSGISPDSLNFMQLIDRIEKINYVKRADIHVEPSGNLVVRITERKPLALLSDGEKKIYVDKEGMRLPPVSSKSVDVPILYGFKAHPLTDTLESEAFAAVRNFLVEVRKNPLSDATISEVAWTEKEGVIALTDENGVKLLFGKSNYKNRLRNWEAFYGEVIRTKGIAKMRSVDLRFRGQIVTKET